jgi:hypothetical protein
MNIAARGFDSALASLLLKHQLFYSNAVDNESRSALAMSDPLRCDASGCSICLSTQPIPAGQAVALSCSHRYHSSCWRNLKTAKGVLFKSCPDCKAAKDAAAELMTQPGYGDTQLVTELMILAGFRGADTVEELPNDAQEVAKQAEQLTKEEQPEHRPMEDHSDHRMEDEQPEQHAKEEQLGQRAVDEQLEQRAVEAHPEKR